MILPFLAVVAAAKAPCSDAASVEQQSAVMKNLYDDYEDAREDRFATELLSDEARKADKRRVKEARKYDKQDKLCTGQDKWYAAWIMQSSTDFEDLQRAYQLATQTMEERVPRGPWLTAYTYDRMRTADGYRQAFGTQTRVDKENRRCLIELDGTVDDKKRQAYSVPPLGSLYRQVLDMNGFDKDAPTETRMRRRSLMCEPVAQFDIGTTRKAPGN
ncbi:MAG: hypothetical protein AAF211_02640 [Myxococcota bacterium]